MISEEQELLVNYLKKVQNERGITLNKFADELEINPSILSRILSQTTEPSNSTLEKIAKKLGLPNAENLQKRVQAQSKIGFEINNVKVGVPYMVAMSGVLSLIKRNRLPENIAVTFCEDQEATPFFVKDAQELTTFEEQPDVFQNHFSAENLIKNLENDLLDCIIVPKNNVRNKDIFEVAQVVEGWSVCLYAIQKKAKKASKSNNFEAFLEKIKTKNVVVAYFQNTIVEPQLNVFLNNEVIKKALPNLAESLQELSNCGEDYFLKVKEKLLNDENFMWLLVGFEPLTNSIFNQYFAENLIYERHNLSKFVGEKVKFSLFTHRNTLENTFKLKKIQEFLKKLEGERFQTQQIDVFNTQIARLFFTEKTTATNEISKVERLNLALDEIDFDAPHLYFSAFVDVILEKVK